MHSRSRQGSLANSEISWRCSIWSRLRTFSTQCMHSALSQFLIRLNDYSVPDMRISRHSGYYGHRSDTSLFLFLIYRLILAVVIIF